MTIQEWFRRGYPRCAIASALSVTEGTVRYHLRRLARCTADGRAREVQKASGWSDAIRWWLAGQVSLTASIEPIQDHLKEAS